MKVWNREVTKCGECYLCHEFTDCSNKIFHRCSESAYLVNFDIIDIDCPFSKPLSKLDIENCGFIMFIDYGAGTDYKFGDKYLLRTFKYSGITYNKNQIAIFENSGIFDDKYTSRLFIGNINNLPEFKLILKMLNIEIYEKNIN